MSIKKKVSKKKAGRKKVAQAPVEPGCYNCLYSKPNPLTTDTVRCHRYPTIMKALPTHWCGEYKVK